MFDLYNDKFEVYYKTRTGMSKRKGFETKKEIKNWCKRQKGKIRISGGSYQVLDIYDSISK